MDWSIDLFFLKYEHLQIEVNTKVVQEQSSNIFVAKSGDQRLFVSFDRDIN